MPESGSVHIDHRAGLRLTVPEEWTIETTGLVPPLTFAASGPAREIDAETREARAIAEEQALWEMAADYRSSVELPTYPEDNEAAMVLAGRWENLFEAPPTTEELEAGAAWLATSYGEYLELVPPVSGPFTDRSVERYTIAGLPAAHATQRTVGTRAQPTMYVRAVVVELTDGRVSFVLGMAEPETERALIDAILDGVEPL